MHNLVITGPTASGKTALAVAVCRKIGGEIISADSRQVYRGMDIGTGKDLEEYRKGGAPVPWHLINIRNPGEKYHVHAFQEDALEAASRIRAEGHVPVFCGGTGLYLESVLESHAYTGIPVDQEFRNKLRRKDKAALIRRYESGKPLPFTVDKNSTKRLIRALEMQTYLRTHQVPPASPLPGAFITFLVDIPLGERRKRIADRLDARLNEGLVEEVRTLLRTHSPAELLYYGLEYKYITEYLIGERSYEEMHHKLKTEIHRFAKRQMTWFRRMERKGHQLIRIDGMQPLSQQVEQVLNKLY